MINQTRLLNTERRPHWSLWWWFMLANALSLLLGWGIMAKLLLEPLPFKSRYNYGLEPPFTQPSTIQTFLVVILAGITIGSLLGFLQWLRLRPYFHNSPTWIIFSCVAYALSSPIFILGSLAWIGWLDGRLEANTNPLPVEQVGPIWFAGATLIGATTGLIIGVVQWLALRNLAHGIMRWLLTNALSGAIGLTIGAVILGIALSLGMSLFSDLAGYIYIPGMWFSIVAAAASSAGIVLVSGAINSISLLKLLRQESANINQQPQ